MGNSGMYETSFNDSKWREQSRSCTRRKVGSSRLMCQSLNDPAAPLFILDTSSERDARARIDIEFETDMLERRPDRLAIHNEGLHTVFYFDIKDSYTLASVDTGQTMDEILQASVTAARGEAGSEAGRYGLCREEARLSEADQIRDWLEAGGQGSFLKSSLCPGPDELDQFSARALNFRPARMMSVNALYSVEGTCLRADYFTLENHTLSKHAGILKCIGQATQSRTSLEELSKHYLLDLVDPLGEILVAAEQTERLSVDEAKLCTLKNLHFGLVRACVASERLKAPSFELIEECMKLGIPICKDQNFDRDSSRKVLECARSYGLPHYLYVGTDESHSRYNSGGEPSSSVVYEVSREANAKGIAYVGDCPGGRSSSTQVVNAKHESAGIADRSIQFLIEFRSRNNMNELRGRLRGYGSCHSCGRSSGLFGCGIFCGDCNRTWCDEFEKTSGKSMLEPEQVRKKRGIRTRRSVEMAA